MNPKHVFGIRCAMCGRMKTEGDKKALARTAKAEGWRRVPIMDDGEVAKKIPVCPDCLRTNPTVEIFGLVEYAA